MSARTPLAAALGAVGFVATDFVTSALRVPVLWYHPVQREFSFGVTAPSPAMDLYGHLLWSAVMFVALFGLGRVAFAALDEGAQRRWSNRLALWLATVCVFSAALHVTTLAARTPTPLERPR